MSPFTVKRALPQSFSLYSVKTARNLGLLKEGDFSKEQADSQVAENQQIRPYQTAQEFRDDLELIKNSLLENNDSALVSGDLTEVIQAVDVFGFFLASIDMRQDSSVHEACVAELLASANIVPNYSDLSEEEKIEVLLKELIEDPRTLSSTHVAKSEELQKN